MKSGASGKTKVFAGVDLVQVSQVAASIGRLGDLYLQRICTPAEIAYCNSSPVMTPARVAARFAAKEATLKALRLPDQGLDLRSIEVVQAPGGWCDLELHGRAQEMATAAGWQSWTVSLSHEGDYAAAVVAVLAEARSAT